MDVGMPEPPTLDVPDDQTDDYRRQEIEVHLEEGAWEEAFTQWLAETDLEEDAYEIALDLGLFGDFDFFWDEFAQRVGYAAPGIADDWDQHEYHPDLTSWRQVSSINAGLAELGQRICDLLKDDYLEWEDDDWGDDLDLPSYD